MKSIEVTIADKVLIGILLLISIIGIISRFVLFQEQTSPVAQIQVDGKLVKTIALKKGYYETFRIGGQTEYALIEARDGKIRIRQDDSPRQIGVQTGWISKSPQQVINLPYRIVITLISSESLDIDDIAI